MADLGIPPLQEPLAQLERALIDDFIRSRGHDPDELRGRTDAAARQLLTEASTHAATRLTEVESRAQYVHSIHGTPGSRR